MNEDDEEYVIELSRRMFIETGYAKAGLSFDTEKVRSQLRRVYGSSDRNRMLALVALEGETIVGALIAFATETFFSEELMASEAMWYVYPGYPRHAAELFKAYEFWAGIIGAKAVTVAKLPDVNGFLVGPNYEKRGYEINQLALIKGVNNGN
jgi:hypothetical protein